MFRVTSFEVWKWISSFEIIQTDRLTKFCNKTLPMTGPLCLPLLQKPPQAKAHLKTILWHFSRKVIQDHMSLGWGLQKIWWYKTVQERIVVKKSFSGKEETESQKNRKKNKFPCFYPEFGEYLREIWERFFRKVSRNAIPLIVSLENVTFYFFAWFQKKKKNSLKFPSEMLTEVDTFHIKPVKGLPMFKQVPLPAESWWKLSQTSGDPWGLLCLWLLRTIDLDLHTSQREMCPLAFWCLRTLPERTAPLKDNHSLGSM